MGVRIIVKNADYSATGISYYAPDLARYFASSGIQDNITMSEKNAIVKVYNSLKEGVDPLWNYMDAFYPLIGNANGIKENLLHVSNYKMTRDDSLDPPIIDSLGIKNTLNNAPWDTHRLLDKTNYPGNPEGGGGSLNYWFYKTTPTTNATAGDYGQDFYKLGRTATNVRTIIGDGNGEIVLSYGIAYEKGLVMYQSNYKSVGLDEEHLIIDGLKKVSYDITGNASTINSAGHTNHRSGKLGMTNGLSTNSVGWVDRFGCAGFGKALSDLQIKKLNNIIQTYLFEVGRITESDKDERIID